MIHGEGTMVYSNGEKYHGMWMKDRRNGLGTHHFRDTSRFEGEWVNDDMMGLGTFYYRNGSVYQGEWVDNRRHGSGKLSVFAREGGAIDRQGCRHGPRPTQDSDKYKWRHFRSLQVGQEELNTWVL